MKKNVSIKLLALGAVSCLAFSVGALNVNLNAKASDDTTETAAQTVETFEMANGAAVRVRSQEDVPFKDVTGIRFTMYFNQNKYSDLVNADGTIKSDYKVGMYIAQWEDGMTTVTADTADWTYEATNLVSVTAAEAETDVDVYAFRAVLASLPEENFNTKLIANGYITKDETTTEATNPQTRSIAQVASKALLADSKVAEEDQEYDPYYDLERYVDGVVTEENFKLAETLTTDKYKSGTLNDKLGAAFPEDLSVVWTNDNSNVVTIDEETNALSLGTTYGTATLTATLGNKELTTKVTYGEPKVITVTSDTAYMINYNANASDTYRVYLSSNSEELSAIKGDYEGNAVKYTYLNGYGDIFRVNNPYTLEELNKIAVAYNKVTMWIAKNFVNESDETQKLSYWGGFLASAGFNPNDATNNEWYKISADIADFIKLVEAETNNAFFEIWRAELYEYNEYSGVYIGDIGFEYVEPTILTVDKATALKIKKGTTVGTYIAADADEIKDFSGNYAGAASKIQIGTITLPPALTASEVSALATEKSYTYVSMWIAFGVETTSTTDAYVNMYSTVSGSSFYYKAENKKNVNFGNSTVKNSVWYKVQMEIDTYVSLYGESDTIDLFKGSSVNINTTNSYIYFGDIIFE